MDGFSSHTFKWVNDEGKSYWVKYHFRSESGIQNLTQDEAAKVKSEDPDHATRDLFNHINEGKTADWTLNIQIMPYEDGFKYKWNIFDVTKVIDSKFLEIRFEFFAFYKSKSELIISHPSHHYSSQNTLTF